MARSRTPRRRAEPPAKPTAPKAKFAGFVQQGVEDEFEKLSDKKVADYIKRLGASLGGKQLCSEKVSAAQLAAIAAQLKDDKNPSPDFAVFTPFGKRTQDKMLSLEDVWIRARLTEMCIRGSSTYEQWKGSWRAFRFSMFALDGCSPAPFDTYGHLISGLYAQ